MKLELTSASQFVAQLGGSDSRQNDLKTVMEMWHDNDAAVKSKFLMVAAGLKDVYDRAVKALTDGIDHQLW